MAEFGRKFTSEIIEIICDLIFIVVEHRGEDTPFQWLKSRFELLDTSNRKHRNVLELVKIVSKARISSKFGF